MVNASIVEGNTADGSSAIFRNRSKSKHDQGGEKEDPRKVLSLPDATRAQVAKKYGKWGRVLGRGRDGTVRLIKGSAGSGGAVFAVKQFHERRTGESEKEYQKKITAHFCVGIALKNQNVIETIDIVWDNGNYYEVMEYAPFDLYSILMTGKMSRIEIYCVFRQICAGVEYLHELGLAHRNLKLKKCLLTADNVVKLIDFGTATVFHYPGRTIALATGIVGSDNYIAPEVFGGEPYDLRKADVWSIGIMFVSFMLRRFPWGLADPETDRSFKAFVDPGLDISLRLPMRARKNSRVVSGNAPDLRDSKSLGPRGTRTSSAASIDSYTHRQRYIKQPARGTLHTGIAQQLN
ncbi:kinase-like domain-containing protein [Mycena crocata]|nr:kinase-like domain-containing protein [Mycena crocata]